MNGQKYRESKQKILSWLLITTFLVGISITGILSVNTATAPMATDQLNTDVALSANTITLAKNWTYGSGVTNDQGMAIARDSLGFLYLAGVTNESGSFDVYLIKIDPQGNKLWDIKWGGPGVEVTQGIAIDGSNNIYITGQTSSDGLGIFNLFLLKYSSGGIWQWNYTWSHVSKMSNGHNIVFDGSNNVYVVGSTNHLGSYDMVVIKYNSAGTEIWNTTWGGADSEYGWSIAIDGSSLYIAGGTKSYGNGDIDLALLKIATADGALQNNATWGGSKADSINAIIVESSAIYLSGTTWSSGAGGSDVVALKYDMALNLQWMKTYGGAGTTNETSSGLAHFNNSLIVVGMILNTTPMFPYGYDILLVQFYTTGDYLDHIIWDYGGNEPGLFIDLFIVPNGDVYVIGSTDFGDATGAILLAKFWPDYNLTPGGGIPAFGTQFLLVGLLLTVAIVLVLRKKSQYLPI